ncbi:hypothetical protein [Paenibacillus sacheonensis]|uniref:Uncharacterized protein n=1 Tax=Paenibacillus sacheonensis TaxID=742054 RepID=A0A7X4YXT9_9BACL|nr:hypothetical protein [Paenibacillus sacheonensis]MBM7569525.1 hypothetical protein [Paenibacillus sacheonensis]NBC73584.1 hypothetical protein [Paenibacillus sacheonensis]
MKRKAIIHISENADTLNKIMSIFENRLDEIKLYPNHFLEIKTDEEASGYEEIMSLIVKEKWRHTFHEEREYSKQEMKAAKYFHIGVAYPWEHDPMKDAEYYGTTYEYLKSKSCNCNKVQVSKLQLDVKKLGKWKNMAHIRPEYIITEYTKLLIENNELSGCEIREAIDYKGRELHPVFQLVVTNIVPPMQEVVRIEPYSHMEAHCESCSSKGFLRSELIYRKEELEKFKDFNFTFEYWDAYHIRQPIVSAKVRELFTKHKVRVFRYEPVRFI